MTDQIAPNKTLYGLRAIAEHAGVSHQTIARWIERGMPHTVQTLGKTSMIVVESDDMVVFTATINRTPGRPAKQNES